MTRGVRSSLTLLLAASNDANDPGLIHRDCAGVRSGTTSVTRCLGVATRSRPVSSLPVRCAFNLSIVGDRMLYKTYRYLARTAMFSGRF